MGPYPRSTKSVLKVGLHIEASLKLGTADLVKDIEKIALLIVAAAKN